MSNTGQELVAPGGALATTGGGRPSMQIGSFGALLAAAAQAASAKGKAVEQVVAVHQSSTHTHYAGVGAVALHPNPTLAIESKRTNGERYDTTKNIKVDADPTAESPSQYAVYKLDPFKFKDGIEEIDPKKLHDSIEYAGLRTGKAHKPLPTIADALAQAMGPIRIFTVERAILGGPTYDVIKENESGFATVLGDSEGKVLPLWGEMTLASLDLIPENDVQDQLKALVDAISDTDPKKGLSNPRTLGGDISKPETALTESSLNYTFQSLRTWVYDPHFSLYTYVRIRLVAVIEPLPAGKFWFGPKEVTKGDDKLEVFKDPWLMKGVQGCTHPGNNSFLPFGDYVFCKEHLTEHLTKGTAKNRRIPPNVKLSELMTVLLPHLFSTGTGQANMSKPPSNASVRMGRAPVTPAHPFKLPLIKGAACTTDAATMRREAVEMVQSMTTQFTTGAPQAKRLCLTDSRLGDVEPDQVYATEGNIANALLDTSKLPENFPDFMIGTYSAQSTAAEPNFLDDESTSPAGSFSFKSSEWGGEFQNPLFWTCFLLWTGCNCKCKSDLNEMMQRNARHPDGTGDEKKLRDASCGLLGLMIAILLRIRCKFLTEEAAKQFMVVVRLYDEELNSESDPFKILQNIMKDSFRSARGVQINVSAMPTDEQVENWIYVAYRMTNENPLGNNITVALEQLENAREAALEEAKTYLSERLLRDS